MKRIFVTLDILFFSIQSHAYTWTSDMFQLTDATPTGLCNKMNSGNPGMTVVIDGTTSGYCLLNGKSFTGNSIRRLGTSCPITGQSYNSSTGTCSCPSGSTVQNGACVESNPCTSKNGTSLAFTKSGSSGDGYGTISGGFVAAAQSACSGGCAMSTVDQKCTGRVSGLYTCRGTGYFTGQKCSTSGVGSDIQENTSQQPLPTPQTINDEKPCVYSQDGSKQVCQSSKTNEKEGQYCGTVNGVKKCVDSKPTKNGITIDTTVETVTKPDGSKVITKTDVATKTTCTGAGQCTSTSTTTTTTTNTNANGDTTGVTGSCTGDACPDENTNPDGDGDGFGDCTGDDCGGGEGGSLNIGELPEFGDGTPTYGETMSAFVDKVQTIGFIAAARNISIPSGGGSCSVQPINIFGSSVSVDSFCETVPLILQPLSYLFLALWGWIAIRIILSA